MEWTASGIVLGHKKHGESSLILEVMTRERGRHLGLVRGGRSRRMAALLQVGNTLSLTWRARLDEHLGLFQVDGETLRGAQLMDEPVALLSAQLCAAHLRLLPERDPHARLHDMLTLILDQYDEPQTLAALVARFEVLLLEELGFGLDLTKCAGTGVQSGLIYVSPKSGRAVSADAGAPYRDKLLALPAFLTGSMDQVLAKDTLDAFRLTAFFLERNVWGPRAVRPPEGRDALIRRIGGQSSPSMASTA
ncbi:MAG: DNA repair protein RecO [Rhizobiales bacterium]|nr:DNA repair protein RecO [Hyphomicrobiales bacterium]MBO6698302.1 DNA repair protein RecO [Hyphomicrobiales bacterium]MBO6735444.1 DNA repair protein RecO [Hyphomicrobiales bacterium]MBO6910748.1 DNA repair protein RecO [Hyphomicrobiales bacterium]MBO6956757.1 DNA repair protein RecO [Hyphomicrobiales bacterium]